MERGELECRVLIKGISMSKTSICDSVSRQMKVDHLKFNGTRKNVHGHKIRGFKVKIKEILDH